LQLLRTSNSIATPEQLAALIRNPEVPKFCQVAERDRREWLAHVINTLHYLAHSAKPGDDTDKAIEATFADKLIMEDPVLRGLTQVEMQEAFMKGVGREYGDFYGITASSLVSFLRGFLKSEKRLQAKAIVREAEERERAEADRRFWKEISRAVHEDGFQVPDFGNKAELREAYDEHRRKIAAQREAIYRANGGGKA